jgi:hypothetical protein
MYINPFVAGLIVGAVGVLILLAIWGTVSKKKS